MKKTFKLEGLDCANCAAKMERAIKKIEDVSSATVNFMTGKLILEAKEDSFEGIVEKVKVVVKKVEPDVIIK